MIMSYLTWFLLTGSTTLTFRPTLARFEDLRVLRRFLLEILKKLVVPEPPFHPDRVMDT